MIDEKSLADGVRERATDDTPQSHQAPERRRWADFLKHRWPTVLAIAFAVLVAFDLEDGSDLYFLLFVFGLGYLVPAALNKP